MTTLLPLFASCAKPLEGLLADEIVQLGGVDCRQTVAGVRFSGSLETAYRICLWSRIANHVLLFLKRFRAEDADNLYRGIQSIDWKQHLTPTGSFCIDVTGRHSHINNTLFIAQRAKDAIVDQLRTPAGERPSVVQLYPDLRLHLHCEGDEIELAIDLSGESLHRRGYRLEGGKAPLKETLAAAVLIRAGWPEQLKQSPAIFLDPMCGTGTFLVEAALIAFDIAPGLLREHYGFLYWKQHQADVWERLVDEAQKRKIAGLERQDVLIEGSDIHEMAIEKSESNIARAGLSNRIRVSRGDCRELPAPRSIETGLIVSNPPYGERLSYDEIDSLKAMFHHLGDRLKENYLGWRLAVISGAAPEVTKSLGFRASKLYSFFNGTLPCKLYCFDLLEEKRMRYETAEEKQQRVIENTIGRGLSDGATMFLNRLKKNEKHLRKWRQREKIDCYRVYDADIPEYSFAVDIYTVHEKNSEKTELFAHVQEYEPGQFVDPKKAEERRREVPAVIYEAFQLPSSQIISKLRKRQRGESQYERVAEEKQFHLIQEGDARFWVNFHDYLDTGIFIDHQLVRKRLASFAKGKMVLNLFSYTCSASIQALLAGARRVTNVDLSHTYLEWGKRNFVLNKLSPSQHEFLHEDCFAWLKSHTRKYDVIFLNPPTFSNSKRMTGTWDALRDHAELIRETMAHLTSEGCLLFSCNQRGFKLDPGIENAFDCVNISRSTLRKDFESQVKRHHVWEIKHRIP